VPKAAFFHKIAHLTLNQAIWRHFRQIANISTGKRDKGKTISQRVDKKGALNKRGGLSGPDKAIDCFPLMTRKGRLTTSNKKAGVLPAFTN